MDTSNIVFGRADIVVDGTLWSNVLSHAPILLRESIIGSLLMTASSWGVEGSLPVLLVIIAAGLGTGILFVTSLIAYARRRSRQYLLISVAVGALWARSIVGLGTLYGYVPMPIHHFIEHSLDFFIAAVVLYAVYAFAPGSLPDHTEES